MYEDERRISVAPAVPASSRQLHTRGIYLSIIAHWGQKHWRLAPFTSPQRQWIERSIVCVVSYEAVEEHSTKFAAFSSRSLELTGRGMVLVGVLPEHNAVEREFFIAPWE
jgi:hypothetical protein